MSESKIKENNPVVIQVIDNIISLRNKRGYSQEYMAQEMNLSTLSYSKIENLQTRLHADRIAEIATILEVAPAVLWLTDAQPKTEHDCKMYFLQQQTLKLMEKIYEKFPQLIQLLHL